LIQVFKPSLGQEELDALAEIFKTGWIGLGPKTAEFEQKFAEYVGVKHAVAVNSATAALHLSCLALGIGSGDEVLVPTITFVSTVHAVSYCGAKPVFVDVDPETFNIDTEDIIRKITPKTKAIIPVHYGGHACDMVHIWDIASEYNLFVIEDAAHACGGEYFGYKIGGLSQTVFTCFSFQAVKNLPTGDGGMITTNDDTKVALLNRLRWCGIDKSTWDRTEKNEHTQYGWYYEIKDLGLKCHMNDISAVIGLCQLKKLDEMNNRRREITNMYNKAFSDTPWINIPVELDYAKSACHNYVIKTPYRNELNLYLKEKGIATGVHYLPIHLQPYYRNQEEVSLPVAERVWKLLLTLPLYPSLTNDDVNYIIQSVLDYRFRA